MPEIGSVWKLKPEWMSRLTREKSYVEVVDRRVVGGVPQSFAAYQVGAQQWINDDRWDIYFVEVPDYRDDEVIRG